MNYFLFQVCVPQALSAVGAQLNLFSPVTFQKSSEYNLITKSQSAHYNMCH